MMIEEKRTIRPGTEADARGGPPYPFDDVPETQPLLSEHAVAAGKNFLIALMQLPKRIVFSGPVLSVLIFSAAYGLWNAFFPVSAQKAGNLVWATIDKTAEVVGSWADKAKAGPSKPKP